VTPGSGWKRFFRMSESETHVKDQVDDELRHHIEELLDRYRAEGMSEEEARAAVRRRFPDAEITRSELIGSTGRTVSNRRRRLFLDGLRSDLRVSLRQFRRRPGFTTLAVLTLGLGIGASTTLFSVVNGMLLRPLPYPESEDLLYIGTCMVSTPEWVGACTAPEFLALADRTAVIEQLAASRQTTLDVTGGDRPVRLTAAGITEDFFGVLRSIPQLGRSFTAQDYLPGAEQVVIVNHQLWQQRWNGDPDIIGTTFTAAKQDAKERYTFTIVGVMGPEFRQPQAMEDPSREHSDTALWMPLPLAGTPEADRWHTFNLNTIARLQTGRHSDEARAEVEALVTALAAEHPEWYSGQYFEGRGLGVTSLHETTVKRQRGDVLILFGATGLLLLIAIANLTGLFLARALDRTEELAVRSALGAGRGRIIRQLATESTALALFGCGLGFVFAIGGLHLFRHLAPASFPRVEDIALDLRVVLFAGGIAVAVGMLCGIVPALVNTRRADASFLRSRERGGRRATARLRAVLVTTELALAVVLLIGAGLLVKSFQRLQRVDPGVSTDNLFVMPLDLPQSYETNEQIMTLLNALGQRIRSLPGVRSASWTPDPPVGSPMWWPHVRLEDFEADEEFPQMNVHFVGLDYFETMGIPLLSGRGFTAADDESGEQVVVVDEVLVARYWPDENPLGKRLCLNPEYAGENWYTVIGVVGSIRQSLYVDPQPCLYFSWFQGFFSNQVSMVIRCDLPAESIAPQLRAAVWEVDPNLPVPVIESMSSRIDEVLKTPRFRTLLLGSFALSALILTVAGIYALMLYLVTGRIREIGIRMALGADSRTVLWTVSRQCAGLIGIGTLAGLIVAAVASHLLTSLLFDIAPLDLPTYAGVAAILALISVLACLVPARRAVQLDPMTVLREE